MLSITRLEKCDVAKFYTPRTKSFYILKSVTCEFDLDMEGIRGGRIYSEKDGLEPHLDLNDNYM